MPKCATGLKHNTVYAVNIGLTGTELRIDKPMHWSYFPEESTAFHRISFPHNFSEWMVPAGCCSIQAEISASVYRPRDESSLIKDTLNDLVNVGIIREEEAIPVSQGGRLLVDNTMKLIPAYIIYDLKHGENTKTLKNYLRAANILSRGRFGEWEVPEHGPRHT